MHNVTLTAATLSTITALGYTVVQNSGGEYVYGIMNGMGRVVPSGVSASDAPPHGLQTNLRPTAAAFKEDCENKLCGNPNPPPPAGGRRLRSRGSRKLLPNPTGTLKNLVVLIRFSDHTGRTMPPETNIGILMNSQTPDPSICPTGSVWKVFQQSSYEQLNLDSTVALWVTVPNTETYYANGNSGLTTKTHELIRDAMNVINADPTINLANFDTDSDKYIDSITFLHSGYGAEWGGNDAYGTNYVNRIWSHKWAVYSLPGGYWVGSAGVRVYNYHISPAVWGTSGSAIGRIGVIAHETGHFLGLPDLYDGSVGSGIGSFGLMANSW